MSVQVEALFEERDRLRHLVIGAEDRRVAAGGAGADVTSFEDTDVRDPMAGREVVGRGEAMAATSDYHDVVAAFRSGRAQICAPAQQTAHAGAASSTAAWPALSARS